MFKALIAKNDEADFLLGQIAWADKVLSNPAVVYENGRHSHEVANTVKDDAELELIKHYRLQVIA